MVDIGLNLIDSVYNHLGKIEPSERKEIFFKAFNFWFQYEDDSKVLENLITHYFNTFILEDDIVDGSVKRRGSICSHLVFGIPATINSVGYQYFWLLSRLFTLVDKEKMAEIAQTYIEWQLNGRIGQSMEIAWRENLIVPTEEDFRKMACLKTGYIFRFVYRILSIITGKNMNFDKISDLLGYWSQMLNDLKNLRNKGIKHKAFAEDITEGKMTIPIIHALNKNPNDTTILTILKMKTQDTELKSLVIEHLEKAGSFKYAEQVLNKVQKELIEEIERLGGNPILEKIIAHNMYYDE